MCSCCRNAQVVFLMESRIKKSVYEIRNIDFYFILCQKIKQIFSNLSLSSFHGGALYAYRPFKYFSSCRIALSHTKTSDV